MHLHRTYQISVSDSWYSNQDRKWIRHHLSYVINPKQTSLNTILLYPVWIVLYGIELLHNKYHYWMVWLKSTLQIVTTFLCFLSSTQGYRRNEMLQNIPYIVSISWKRWKFQTNNIKISCIMERNDPPPFTRYISVASCGATGIQICIYVANSKFVTPDIYKIIQNVPFNCVFIHVIL